MLMRNINIRHQHRDRFVHQPHRIISAWDEHTGTS